MKKSTLLLALAASVLISSCTKSLNLNNEGDASVCDSIRVNRISGNLTVPVGGSTTLSVRDFSVVNDFVYINWWGPNNYSDQGHRSIDLNNVNLTTAGWYYVRMSSMNRGCEKIDSVFVNVTMPQGTPPCNLAVNIISYSNMGTSPIMGTSKTFNTLNLKVLRASSATGSTELQFNAYWRDREPVDGVYEVTTNPVQNDNYTNQIHISSIAQSIYFQGNTDGQKIYISHVNGKLQAQFCNISMGGNNGQSWNTAISGTLREQ
ncbi:MAG: hypothetical protein EOO16_04580 [Chitinophagaceae bacterium]|nr:MAG: hypothetical protein EOO16_04580 [Chitinophagaceae bacterium]